MKVDQAATTNLAALESDAVAAAQPLEDDVQVLQQQSTAQPGEVLAALSSSPSLLAADVGGITTVSAEQAQRINNAVQRITADPQKMVNLLTQSLAAVDNLEALAAGAHD